MGFRQYKGENQGLERWLSGLSVCNTLAEDWNLVLRIHIGWFRTILNSKSRESMLFSGLFGNCSDIWENWVWCRLLISVLVRQESQVIEAILDYIIRICHK